MKLGGRDPHAMHRTAGVNADIWHAFNKGDRVWTVEGLPGVVTEVQDGEFSGQEQYLVRLDGDMGGGEYAPGELRRDQPNPRAQGDPGEEVLASRTAAHMGVEQHLASDDYPELEDILAERPPHEYAIPVQSGFRFAKVASGTPGEMPVFRIEGGFSEWMFNQVNKRVPPSVRVNPGDSLVPEGEYWCRFRRDSTCFFPKELDARATDQAGYAVWVPERRGPCPYWTASEQKNMCPVSEPGPRSGEPVSFLDATRRWEEGGQRSGNPGPGYRHDHDDVPKFVHAAKVWTDNEIEARFGRTIEQCDECEEDVIFDEESECFLHIDRNQPDPWRWEAECPNPRKPYFTASRDSELAFHLTAAWRDVRKKATTIRAEGGVHIISAAPKSLYITAYVTGEHALYETRIMRQPGRRTVAMWECGCDWAKYSWARSGRWKKFEGRMCSHALALVYEAQAREMFGGAISDDGRGHPHWRDTDVKTPSGAWGLAASLHEAEAEVADEVPPIVDIAAAMHQGGVDSTHIANWIASIEKNPDRIGRFFRLALDQKPIPVKVRNQFAHVVDIDGNGKVTLDNGQTVAPHEVVYPTWHPTMGLEGPKKWGARTGMAMRQDTLYRGYPLSVSADDDEPALANIARKWAAGTLTAADILASDEGVGQWWSDDWDTAEAYALAGADEPMSRDPDYPPGGNINVIVTATGFEDIGEGVEEIDDGVWEFPPGHRLTVLDVQVNEGGYDNLRWRSLGGRGLSIEAAVHTAMARMPAKAHEVRKGQTIYVQQPGQRAPLRHKVLADPRPSIHGADYVYIRSARQRNDGALWGAHGDILVHKDADIEVDDDPKFASLHVAQDEPTGIMVALDIPEETGKKYEIEGGEPPKEHHVTLAYMKDATQRSSIEAAVSEWCAVIPPMTGQSQGWGTFNNGEENVLWVAWDVPGLSAARASLVAFLAKHGVDVAMDHDFTPHMTVLYSPDAIEELPPWPGTEQVEFPEVVVAQGDDWNRFPFAASIEKAAASDGGLWHEVHEPRARIGAYHQSGMGRGPGDPTKPKHVEITIHGFETSEHAAEYAQRFPKSLNLRATSLTTRDENGQSVQRGIIRGRAILESDKANRGVNETGIKRYHGWMRALEQHGIAHEFSTEATNAYRSREHFEQHLEPRQGVLGPEHEGWTWPVTAAGQGPVRGYHLNLPDDAQQNLIVLCSKCKRNAEARGDVFNVVSELRGAGSGQDPEVCADCGKTIQKLKDSYSAAESYKAKVQALPSEYDAAIESAMQNAFDGQAVAQHDATLHEQPEPALPSTDGADEDGELDPATAAWYEAYGAPVRRDDRRVAVAAAGNREIAETARRVLAGESIQAIAVKDFTAAEMDMLINEGGEIGASNTDRLDIAGTHYEALEAALASAELEGDDETWLA